jgi:CxxC motif-containing protein (DUF1111 family)
MVLPRLVQAGKPQSWRDQVVVWQGKSLFHHSWVANDPLSHGDGVGPVFNERSCVACHGNGGSGGSGPASKNVDLLSASKVGGNRANPSREKLSELHQGFRLTDSVVLHKFGLEPEYDAWRLSVLKKMSGTDSSGFASVPGFSVRRSQRNTPPLFGLGLIDAIPASVIEKAASTPHPEYAQAKGRVSRNPDGSINRFGWKAQLPTLESFVLTACAGELGLESPGHPQAKSGLVPDTRPHELDLTEPQCSALVQYVSALPRPRMIPPSGGRMKASVAVGQDLFTSIGCASCHSPRLGDVDGIYSDLLLHDMGQSLSDSGAYYSVEEPKGQLAKSDEWRTPPLWGLRDSAPYLHDGRARTIAQAIAQHDGQGLYSAKWFHELTVAEKRDLVNFLMTLAAPRSFSRGLTVPDIELSSNAGKGSR